MTPFRLSTVILALLPSFQALAGDFLTYEQFGAVGDGRHDDLEAIVATHNEANRKGLPVKADDSKTYYIGGAAKTAIIRTDTDWGKAHFIIDDIKVERISQFIFEVKSGMAPYEITGLSTLKKGQKNLGVKLRGRSLVLVENSNRRIFIRKGPNQNNGRVQTEVFDVDKNGRINKRQLPIYDYETVTKAVAFPIDKATLHVRGGIFTTIANHYPSQYQYHTRGILVSRSNVIVEGITHFVEGELDHGAPYGGFIRVKETADVTVRNCLLTGHKTYWTIGSAKVPVDMGSYDMQLAYSTNIRVEGITQTNEITDSKYWGLMESSFCKDVHVDNCVMSRFDAHQGVENITLRNSTLGYKMVMIVGCGTALIENCEVKAGSFFWLRGDYGSFWDGDVIMKNCKLTVTSKNCADVTLFQGYNVGDHDFGYECMLPRTIRVDGLTIDDSIVTHPKYTGPNIFATFKRDVTKPGLEPYKVPETVTFRNLRILSGRKMGVSKNTEMFKDVKVIYK